MNVLVIGGSLTGLMHGLMFKRLGHNVRILEQSTSSFRENTAAGMTTGPNGKEFMDSHDLDKRTYSSACVGPQFVDQAGNVTRQMKVQFYLTSWDTLYYRLRANFDGLASGYCPNPPPPLETDGRATYDLGKQVNAIAGHGSLMTVAYEDLLNRKNATCHADLVIVADGANSTIRKLIESNTRLRYSGYVAWRGTVPEAEVSDETRRFFDKGFFTNVLPADHGYMVGYAIPGKDGTLERGLRDFNFVWYSKLPAKSGALQSALTDVSGHQHRNTLPKGMMDPKVWAHQLEEPRKHMSPAFRELAEKVKEPFLSTVNDCAASKATYNHGKFLLVGEALLLNRPHTGISFDTAAFQVLQLERVIRDQTTLEDWEKLVSNNNHRAQLFSFVYGRYLLYGPLRPSFLISLVRFLLYIVWGYFTRLLSK